jgi:DNA-binding NtrC family response regulator
MVTRRLEVVANVNVPVRVDGPVGRGRATRARVVDETSETVPILVASS